MIHPGTARRVWRQFWGPWQLVVAVVGLVLLGWYSEKLVGKLWAHVLEGALFLLLIHAMEKVFFWKELSDTVGDKMESVAARHRDVLGKVLSCGIEYVYVNRGEATTDVTEAIKNARRRIWLLGIAFSKNVKLNTLLAGHSNALVKYIEGKSKDFDLKILLLDPLRSPAVFRSFLESDCDLIKRTIEFQRPGDAGRDPLFQPHTLYREVEETLDFVRHHQVLRDAVRLYAHDPACWMVVTDNMAYYEPYTFGSPRSERPDTCIGEFLPVFRFRGPQGKANEKIENFEAFNILEDHFAKLWITSDVDCFHFEMREHDRENRVTEMFGRRKEWFETVYAALNHWESHKNEWYKARKWPERRQHPRLPCVSGNLPKSELRWKGKAGEKRFEATVVDFSEDGLSATISGREVSTLIRTVDEFRQNQGKDVLKEACCDEEVSMSFPAGGRIADHFAHGNLRMRWFDSRSGALEGRVGVEKVA